MMFVYLSFLFRRDEVSTGSGSDRVAFARPTCSMSRDPVATALGTDLMTTKQLLALQRVIQRLGRPDCRRFVRHRYRQDTNPIIVGQDQRARARR